MSRRTHFLFVVLIVTFMTTGALAQSGQLVAIETAHSALAATAAKTEEAKQPSAVQRFTLPNGLRVVLLEEHSFPLVSCMVWYKVGSKNDEPGKTGLSHLVEHLLFRNIGSFRKNELGATIVRHGGQFNGFTSEDFTAFYSTLPPEQIDLALRGEAERMRQAKFTQADVKGEIARLLKEVVREDKDPLAVLTRDVHQAAFQKHPYRNPPSGLAADIEHLNWEEAHRFYEKYYYPNNATLVLAGDFNSLAVTNLIKKHFAGLAKSPTPLAEVSFKEYKPAAQSHVIVKTAEKKESLLLAYHAPSIVDNDAPAMVVLEKLLNNQITGRLKTKLLDSKLCNYAQAMFEMKRDPGLFMFTSNPVPGISLAKVMDSLDALINQLAQQPVSEAELSRARNQAEFEFYNEIDGPFHACFHLGYFETLLKLPEVYAWPEKIRTVSQDDIMRLTKRYLNSESRVVGKLCSMPPAPVSTPKPSARTRVLPPGKIMTQRTPAAQSLPPQSGREFPYIQRAAYQSEDSSIEPLVQMDSSLSNQSARDKKSAQESSIDNGQEADGHGEQPHASVGVVQPLSKDGDNKTEETNPAHPEGKMPSGAHDTNAASLNTPDSGNVYSRCLENGLNVIVVQSHLSPIVQIVGSINAGQIYESADKKGVSQLLSMCMNLGNSKMTRAQVIADQNDRGLPPGAMLNFEAGIEQIGFKSRCLSKDLPSQLRLLASAMREPRYQDVDIVKAKSELLANIVQNDDSVYSKAERALLRSLIAPGSPYCPLDPNEIANSLNDLKATDLKDFHDAFISPNATTLVLVGDVEPGQIVPLVESVFSDWPSRNALVTKPVLVVSNRQSAKSSLIVKEGQQNIVCLGKIVGGDQESERSERNKEELYDLLIADCVLSNHPIFSRINQRLDVEPTLVTNFSNEQLISRLKPLSNRVVWSLSIPLATSGELKTAADAVLAIQNELRRYGTSGITVHELNEAKRYLSGALPVSLMSNLQQLSESTLDQFLVFGDTNSFAHIGYALAGTSLDSVNMFITHSFKPENSSLVVAGTRQLIHQTHNTSMHQMPAPLSEGEGLPLPTAKSQ